MVGLIHGLGWVGLGSVGTFDEPIGRVGMGCKTNFLAWIVFDKCVPHSSLTV